MSDTATSQTSESILGRVNALDSDAWTRLARIYSPLVYHWCREAGLQRSDIEDVTQEVFRAVASGIGQFLSSRQGKFRGWLWGITRHKLADHFRRTMTAPAPLGGDSGQDFFSRLPEDCPDDASASGINLDVLVIQRTLELLQPEFEATTWQAFWRVTVGQERAAEVAEELQMTTKAVRQAKYRILRRLRLEVQNQLHSPG